VENNAYEIIGIGNAIVDLLEHVEEEFIVRHNLQKSAMQLCTREQQVMLLSQLSEPTIEAGGSVGNSMSTIGLLGLKSAFIGNVAHDDLGDRYIESIQQSNVDFLTPKQHSTLGTGTSVILITPDSERTMNTFLGEAAQISPDSIPHDELKSCRILFIEGYAYENDPQRSAAILATSIVKDHGGLVALTLSDPWCVQKHREQFLKLLPNVDYLLCNHDEFREMFGIDIDSITSSTRDACEEISSLTSAQVIVTRSHQGCSIIDGTTISSLPAIAPDEVRDVTGAGDQFAAGFLSGCRMGYSLEQSAQLGIQLATKVISKIGPRLTPQEINDAQSAWKMSL
jgi:sugar/nucleoside kinase (ribokinase family)